MVAPKPRRRGRCHVPLLGARESRIGSRSIAHQLRIDWNGNRMYEWECPSCGHRQQTETTPCVECGTDRPTVRTPFGNGIDDPSGVGYVVRGLAFAGFLLVLASGLVTLIAVWWYGDIKPWWLESFLYVGGAAAMALSLVVCFVVSRVARRRVDGRGDPTGVAYVVRGLAYEGCLIALTSILVTLLAQWWNGGVTPRWIVASVFVGGVAAIALFLLAYVALSPGVRRRVDGTGDPTGVAYLVRGLVYAVCILVLASGLVTALDGWRYREPDPWWMTSSFLVGGAGAMALSLVVFLVVSRVGRRRLSWWLRK